MTHGSEAGCVHPACLYGSWRDSETEWGSGLTVCPTSQVTRGATLSHSPHTSRHSLTEPLCQILIIRHTLISLAQLPSYHWSASLDQSDVGITLSEGTHTHPTPLCLPLHDWHDPPSTSFTPSSITDGRVLHCKSSEHCCTFQTIPYFLWCLASCESVCVCVPPLSDRPLPYLSAAICKRNQRNIYYL